MHSGRIFLAAFAFLFFGIAVRAADDVAGSSQADNQPPAVGNIANDFALWSLDGKPFRLNDVVAKQPVVLVVLRGYPGYQCPICTKQFGELLGRAKEFADAGAVVTFIYPGKEDKLDEHAKEFLTGKDLPANYRFVVDPDYQFTEFYGLRWNKQGETAYPASFVLDRGGKTLFAKVSKTHEGRATADELLKALAAKK